MRRLLLITALLIGCTGEEEPPPDKGLGFCDLVADGTACDDDDPCTLVDRCRDKVCVGGDLKRCDAGDQCQQAGVCNPATGACENPPKRDGATCDDENACTQADECRAGACVGGSPVTCRRLDACRVAGECDPSTGLCSHPFAPEDTACEDGNPCTEGDVCRRGICEAGTPAVCAEEDECGSAGVCDPATGDCLRDLEPDGTPCEDGDLCSVDDTCRRGICGAGSPRVCASTDPCRIVSGCAPEVGCLVTDHPDGSPCNDGDRCTVDDACADGVCTSTTVVTCTALDQCHDAGTCDPATGCSNPNKADGTFCADNDSCTLVSACAMGVCTASVSVTCPASTEPCLQDSVCDPTDGSCVFPARADGTMCSDANMCTNMDACLTGVCEGTRIPTGITPCADGICFTAVTATVGISFATSPAIYMGAGAAFIDVNADGLLDVALGSETNGVRIWENRGASFVDVTAGLGITVPASDRFMGFAAADYDGDGDTDLYLAIDGPNRLYRNDGATFTNVTPTAGVGDPRWSTGAAFGDYDGDGDLDLYVGNYVQTPNYPNHTPFPNGLYENQGNGTFTDVSTARGVAGAGTTLAVTWSDYDGDGDVDLFACNDFGAFIQPNRLYRNDGGTFTDVSTATGFDVGIFCMGIAAADYDGDLDLDYYFTNLGRNVFLENRGATFVDVTIPTGTALTFDQCRAPLLNTSWGVGFFDFDNDGVEELYVSNGYVPADAAIANAPDSPNALLSAGAPFMDISESAGVADRQVGRGVAFGDYDNDGDVDVLQANVDGDAILLRNDSPLPGAFLTVAPEGRLSNRDGFGSRVEATFGVSTRVREVNANYSYQSSSDPRVHFGAGPAVVADHLRVRWPSGVVQDLFDVPTGMTIAALEPVVTATITAVPATAAGAVLSATALLTNHGATTATVSYTLDVLTAQSTAVVMIPGLSTLTVTPSLTIPSSAPPGLTPALLTVTESGAIDQARSPLSIF